MNIQRTIEAFCPRCEQEQEDKRMMLRYLSMFDDLLYRTNETTHFTASGWIVNPSRTKVLMAYHNIYDSWAWTGGHADGEDDLLGVAIREAKEECSLSDVHAVTRLPMSLEILTVNAHFKRGRYVVPHLHLNLTYLLEADDSQLIRNKPDENSAVKWFSPEEAILASSEPDMRVIYQKLNSRIKA